MSYAPSALSLAQTDTLQRLAWLYGDAAARMEANHPDVMAWRQIGGHVYASDVSSGDRRFTRGIINIAKAALA